MKVTITLLAVLLASPVLAQSTIAAKSIRSDTLGASQATVAVPAAAVLSSTTSAAAAIEVRDGPDAIGLLTARLNSLEKTYESDMAAVKAENNELRSAIKLLQDDAQHPNGMQFLKRSMMQKVGWYRVPDDAWIIYYTFYK